jgi:hypothetical protein
VSVAKNIRHHHTTGNGRNTSSKRDDGVVTFDQLLDGVDAKKQGQQWKGRCPAHDDAKPSLSIDLRDGRVLLNCFAGCTFRAVVDALEWRGLWPVQIDGGNTSTQPYPAVDLATLPPELLKFDDRLVDPRRGVVGRYLAARGLDVAPLCHVIQQHSKAFHGPSGTWWPCMVATIRDVNGQFRSFHRTFLHHVHATKAPVDPVRMVWGGIPVKGCAVQLSPADKTLLLGEGPESVLSAMKIYGMPGWAAMSAGNLAHVLLPELVRAVVIAADNDQPGLNAAVAAAQRFRGQGRKARIIKPSNEVGDFNDLLMQRSTCRKIATVRV